MTWLEIAGATAWLAAYVSSSYAVATTTPRPWPYLYPFAGLLIFPIAYLTAVWEFGPWTALISGTVVATAATAVATRRRARRPKP